MLYTDYPLRTALLDIFPYLADHGMGERWNLLLLVFLSSCFCPRTGFRTEEFGTQSKAKVDP